CLAAGSGSANSLCKENDAGGLNGLIAWLKANPNKASAGFGTSPLRLVTAYFRTETRTQFSPSYRIVARARIAGPRRRPDRLVILHTRCAATGAGRERKSLCGGK